jgi:muramoyltetrapeptide carboxypeptidase
VKIAVVVPSGPPDREFLETGKREVRARWPEVDFIEAPNIDARLGYLAGDDAVRIAGLRWALEESGAEIVWLARGGFGATRIVGSIPWDAIASRPDAPVLMGYSDATALLAGYDAAGGRAVHGPMLATDLARGGHPRTWESLGRLLLDGAGGAAGAGNAAGAAPREDRFECEGRFLSRERALSGRIMAANLTVLAALAGTRHFPSGVGRVIGLEEVKEEPYRVDRCLTQLREAGLFRECAGVVFGSMTECVPEEPEKSMPLETVLERFAAETSVPVAVGLPFGHGGVNTLLPWSGEIALSETSAVAVLGARVMRAG